jgi:hypothetical protein
MATGADENNFIEHKSFAASHSALSRTEPIVRFPPNKNEWRTGRSYASYGRAAPGSPTSSSKSIR